ncbi:MAG: tetratricopeptide repeat protein, partial [Planctomycetes bacterium]|nr:tetratricopeptide repeat protein [Planctomycetota bacterium]
MELHLQSLVILEQLGLQRHIAAVLGTIGGVHHALGDLEAARSFYRRSLRIWEREGDPVHT